MSERNGIPAVVQTVFPIWVPTDGDGPPQLSVGEGYLEDGKLVINFKESLPAVAMQRMISRGVFLGLSFVLMEEDPLEGLVVESPIAVTEEVVTGKDDVAISETIITVDEPSS